MVLDAIAALLLGLVLFVEETSENHRAVERHMTNHRVCNNSSAIGATIEAGTTYPSGIHPHVWWGSCCSIV
jgi:hypothetical protein